MKAEKQEQVKNKLSMKVTSMSLDKEDLKAFCDILQEKANASAEIEVPLFQQNQQTDEEYKANLETLRKSFKLNFTLNGKNGVQLWGKAEDVFSSVNFPDDVVSLYVDSENTLKHGYNYYPHNSFKVFFDFSKPNVFDFDLMPSHSTPNESNIEVSGYNPTWVNGVFHELKMFIDNRSSTLSIVHNHSIYDMLLWVVGLPVSFWLCNKLSPEIDAAFSVDNTFFTNALYLYVFVITLICFRIMFHYVRWVCPLVEFRYKNSKVVAHRLVIFGLNLGWLGTIIYDMLT